MLELWRENCKLIWKLQTHMKIANVHVGTIHQNMRIANWYENCKLIWKLQTDMRIVKQFSCFSVFSMWTFAIFIWDTAGMKTCSGTECFGSIAVWMTKTQQNNLLQNLPLFIFSYQFLCWRSLIHILSHDSSALQQILLTKRWSLNCPLLYWRGQIFLGKNT